MIEVKKIKEKVDLKDMEINGNDPCRYIWHSHQKSGAINCLSDCTKCGTDKKGNQIKHCAYGINEY